jgi:hypothetical protein
MATSVLSLESQLYDLFANAHLFQLFNLVQESASWSQNDRREKRQEERGAGSLLCSP